MTTNPSWASDTIVSMPVPPNLDNPDRVVQMGGFCFTENGLAHDITDTTVEQIADEGRGGFESV